MSWNWDDMRYFLAVCRKQSFIGAAAELKVTHTTVSRRISALEESLECQLFMRTERGCRLTTEGELLVPYAEQVESTVINLEGKIAGRDRRLTGSVRVGAPDGLGNCFLASRLVAFQQNNPELNVELVAAPHYYSLAKREIDILITVRKPMVGKVIARKLTDYKLGLFASQSYIDTHAPIDSRRDLHRHRFVTYIEEFLFDQDLRLMEEVDSGLQTSFRSSTVFAQLAATVAGAGIGIIPYFMANQEPALIPVLSAYSIDRKFWLQVNPDSQQLARVRATIDFLVNELEGERALFIELANPSRIGISPSRIESLTGDRSPDGNNRSAS